MRHWFIMHCSSGLHQITYMICHRGHLLSLRKNHSIDVTVEQLNRFFLCVCVCVKGECSYMLGNYGLRALMFFLIIIQMHWNDDTTIRIIQFESLSVEDKVLLTVYVQKVNQNFNQSYCSLSKNKILK